MRTGQVQFYSEGSLVSALWRTPDTHVGPVRAVVQGPGWLGLKDAGDYVRYHEGLTSAGFGVLCIDYRGFGTSEGGPAVVSPAAQIEDLRNAVIYLTTRDDVQSEAIGAYATGGTGGANVIALAALEPRIRAVVSQVPIADGRDWLHRMRTEWEWTDFLASVSADRRERVLNGVGREVEPREEIMVQSPERRQTRFKKDVDGRVSAKVPLASVEQVLQYRPVDYARRVEAPVMVIAVEDDAVTPADHSLAIYEAVRGPKRLIMQRNTSHYEAYAKYAGQVIPEIVQWFDRYLVAPGDLAIRADSGDRSRGASDES